MKTKAKAKKIKLTSKKLPQAKPLCIVCLKPRAQAAAFCPACQKDYDYAHKGGQFIHVQGVIEWAARRARFHAHASHLTLVRDAAAEGK